MLKSVLTTAEVIALGGFETVNEVLGVAGYEGSALRAKRPGYWIVIKQGRRMRTTLAA